MFEKGGRDLPKFSIPKVIVVVVQVEVVCQRFRLLRMQKRGLR